MIASSAAGAATIVANDNIDPLDVHLHIGAATVYYAATFSHATSAHGIPLDPGTDLTLSLPPQRHLAVGAPVAFSLTYETLLQP